MHITVCEVYSYMLTYAHGEYVMSGGRAAKAQPSTLVRLLTDDGLEGWGEVSTLAGTYLPSFTDGTRAAIQELASALIGLDPRNLSALHRTMNNVLMGQQSAKSAIDIACWDILGKSTGLSVATLLGGVLQSDFPLYEAVPLGAPESMVEFVRKRSSEGISTFQLKVGNDPKEDVARVRQVSDSVASNITIIADSNGGWTLQNAMVAIREIADLDIYIEQPCRRTEDCALLRRISTLPMVMDESVLSADDLFRAKYEVGAGSVNIKLSRLGGITLCARMRDLAQELGLSVTVEDTWGGDITTAAISHLAASTRPELMLSTCFFNTWTNEHVARKPLRPLGGRGAVPTGAGLGVEVDVEALGKPLFTVG
jgi:L-alanine-DL-glutamate epimerase-like enolase superfamily enzyme